MKILVTRAACCSQDDQLGPLEIQLEFNDGATLEELIKRIIKINFLQYSSSDHMVGTVDGKKIVEIFLRQERVIFHKKKEILAKDFVNKNGLDFDFIDSFLRIKDEEITKTDSNLRRKKKSLFQKLIFWKNTHLT